MKHAMLSRLSIPYRGVRLRTDACRPLPWCMYAVPMVLGPQRWFRLFPNHFVDEPSDADRHEQDRDRVVPNGGHHRVEDVAEGWPA